MTLSSFSEREKGPSVCVCALAVVFFSKRKKIQKKKMEGVTQGRFYERKNVQILRGREWKNAMPTNVEKGGYFGEKFWKLYSQMLI